MDARNLPSLHTSNSKLLFFLVWGEHHLKWMCPEAVAPEAVAPEAVASKAVAGTILLSLSKDIVLLLKSCFIPFCFMKSVPPMTGECSLLHTSARNCSGTLSL